jgi:hypothetical protein
MMEVLKRKEDNWKLRYKLIEISCYIFMAALILGEGYWNHARASDVQWNIQWHWQSPAQSHNHYDHRHRRNVPCVYNCTLGSHDPLPSTTTHTDTHNHVHGVYGVHIHNGVTYLVEHVFRNYRGQMCKEFQVNVQFTFGQRARAWATVCQDRRGHWRLQQ